jgi:hypothetical protein
VLAWVGAIPTVRMRHSGLVHRPSRRRRLAAIGIDLGLLVVVAPLATVVLGWALSWLFYLPVRGNCADPCDGPGMVGFGLALLLLFLLWSLYWPVLVYWRGRTLGSRMVRLEFEGQGLRRHLEWDSRRRPFRHDSEGGQGRPQGRPTGKP